jgi:choline dehydrogenase-like flavoprotein
MSVILTEAPNGLIDDQAVVDPKLCVHGINELRVAYASIMPNVTSRNTNAPSIMIGERGRGDHPHRR